jgi:enoyl-CoA hydratase
MSDEPETIIRLDRRAGRITLNRPKALNALTHSMVLEIEAALLAWREDPAVDLVIVDAVGEKAFCAGGDVQALYRQGIAGDFDSPRRFWAEEYRLNALIAEYPKPYVALMHGITMGGGVGIGAHGSHRIVTETSVVAMPECAIGLIPDVGGSLLLAQAPGRVGLYLGLTGARMNAADAIFAGFADLFIPAASTVEAVETLCDTGDASALARYAKTAPDGRLERLASEIDRIFAADDPETILTALELELSEGAEWRAKAAAAIRSGSPVSVHCTFASVRSAAETRDIRRALDREYRFAARCMEHADFLEGVRAALINKDRNPRWRHGSLAAARADALALMEPLPEGGALEFSSP